MQPFECRSVRYWSFSIGSPFILISRRIWELAGGCSAGLPRALREPQGNAIEREENSYNSGPHPFPTSPDASAASHLSTRGINKGVVSRYAAKRGSEP